MKNWHFFLMMLLLCLLLVLIGLIFYMETLFDNTTEASDCVFYIYTEDEIAELANDIQQNQIGFWHFKHKYKVECVRKTFQGYYAVLLCSNGTRAYVFEKATALPVYSTFKSKDDFSYIQIGQTTKKEIEQFDSIEMASPVSAIISSTHHVKEGVLFITYSLFWNGKKLDEPVVTSVEFIPDNQIQEENATGYGILYLLPVDKAAHKT